MAVHPIRRVAVLLFVVSLTWCRPAAADNPPAIDGGGVKGLDLKTQLQKGLKARRPVEFQYIDEIVDLVKSGKLPIKLVYTTYGWAQAKPTRQLQYFQFALAARTKGLGIPMPNLNNQAVGIGNNGGQHGFGSP